MALDTKFQGRVIGKLSQLSRQEIQINPLRFSTGSYGLFQGRENGEAGTDSRREFRIPARSGGEIVVGA
jgi:hypothetical protein